MIAANGLTIWRSGRLALDRVTLSLAPGRLTAVIGPNGAGKSTLLAALAGLIPGDVTLDGTALSAIPRRDLARRRTYLPQNPHVDWPISVSRVVALGLTPTLPVFGSLSADHASKVASALDECDLTPLADRSATELSGGELARVMLARAIVSDPAILIVDEPTAGLDPRHALDACRRLRDRARKGATVVMAIHDLSLALAYADDVVALRDGCLVAHRPVTEIDEALLAALYDVRVSLDGGAVRFLD